MTYVWTFFDPTASATAYGQRPKFVGAEHSATAEGENCAYGPTLQIWKTKKSSKIEDNTLGILRRSFFPFNALGMPSFNNSEGFKDG